MNYVMSLAVSWRGWGGGGGGGGGRKGAIRLPMFLKGIIACNGTLHVGKIHFTFHPF